MGSGGIENIRGIATTLAATFVACWITKDEVCYYKPLIIGESPSLLMIDARWIKPNNRHNDWIVCHNRESMFQFLQTSSPIFRLRYFLQRIKRLYMSNYHIMCAFTSG